MTLTSKKLCSSTPPRVSNRFCSNFQDRSGLRWGSAVRSLVTIGLVIWPVGDLWPLWSKLLPYTTGVLDLTFDWPMTFGVNIWPLTPRGQHLTFGVKIYPVEARISVVSNMWMFNKDAVLPPSRLIVMFENMHVRHLGTCMDCYYDWLSKNHVILHFSIMEFPFPFQWTFWLFLLVIEFIKAKALTIFIELIYILYYYYYY